jgi:N-acetylmuramoyl-L-alanine amidase
LLRVSSGKAAASEEKVFGFSGRARTIGLLALAFVLGIAYATWLSSGMPAVEGAGTPGSDALVSSTARPTRTPRPTRTVRPSPTPEVSPTPSPTPLPPKVGIVAGHYQSDSGAVCPDGLQEVTINLDVAARVVAILQYEGYQAELLPEFSTKLDGYQAAAFLSIHADSCDVPGASGFKVARVRNSAIPDVEDRLVNCLIQEYGQATALRFHKDSITYDMTGYHAFREIDPLTPAAIIELGFMGADRQLLTERSYEVAQGVALGLACFLEGD